MISYLRVRGLALLDDVELELAPGMNVLTGETGAGKSMIVGALSLLRGGRARAGLVREGVELAVVDAQFEPPADAAARVSVLLGEHGLPEGSLELVVQRSISRTGRGRSMVQGSLTTQTVLGHIGEELIDICSQHEHHFLTHPGKHLDVLDAYAKLLGVRSDYAGAYRAFVAARDELDSVHGHVSAGAQRADYLRFQLEEIERIDPQPGEYDALKGRLGLLRQAQRWVEFARDAHESLYESDDAIAPRLASLRERARGGTEDSEHLAHIEDQLAAAQIACEEAAHAAARFAADLELEPGELDIAEERLHELEKLRRKHQVEVDALLDMAERMRSELDTIEHADDRLAALEAKVERLRGGAVDHAAGLHAGRVEAAKGLARAVEAELAALHLAGARLEVGVEDTGELGPSGADRVEFLFSANPGEPLAPLSRVASGGELSRVLLAIKGVLAAGDRVATYVFDEVDAGVGGAVAEAIGRRLKRAAEQHQVLCITHLPQIAAFGDRHYRVEKRTRKGRTVTSVVALSDEERVDELARMLGGRRVTASAREHARALMSTAG